MEQIGDAGDLQQRFELVFFAELATTTVKPSATKPLRPARGRAGRAGWQESRAEDLAAPLADASARPESRAVEAGDVRQQLVAAHADRPPDRVVRHVDPRFVERVDPGLGVRIVAVDQRSVDVEDGRRGWS